MTDLANAEQVRAIVEPTAKAAASAAIRDFVSQHPHFAPVPSKADTPAYVKWGAGVGATLVAASILWMANTLNQLQITVARIDERQLHDTTGKEIDELKSRVEALESYHRAQPIGGRQ